AAPAEDERAERDADHKEVAADEVGDLGDLVEGVAEAGGCAAGRRGAPRRRGGRLDVDEDAGEVAELRGHEVGVRARHGESVRDHVTLSFLLTCALPVRVVLARAAWSACVSSGLWV